MIKNMVKLGAVSISDMTKDKQFAESQYIFMGKAKQVINYYPYGMIANAPIGELALLFNVGGNSENTFAFPMSSDTRPKGLEEGESQFGNFEVGTSIKFDKNGDVIIVSTKEVTITSPTVNIISTTTHDGDVTINGDLTVNGTITGDTVETSGGIDLDTHTHSPVTDPGDPTKTGLPQ